MAQDFVSAPPARATFDELDRDGKQVRANRLWTAFMSGIYAVCFAQSQAGTTAQRPTVGLYAGRRYWDTDLALPIYYTGSAWVKADGTAA